MVYESLFYIKKTACRTLQTRLLLHSMQSISHFDRAFAAKTDHVSLTSAIITTKNATLPRAGHKAKVLNQAAKDPAAQSSIKYNRSLVAYPFSKEATF